MKNALLIAKGASRGAIDRQLHPQERGAGRVRHRPSDVALDLGTGSTSTKDGRGREKEVERD
jgi:hypothetical protein